MPQLVTSQFGEIEYSEDAVFRFPSGLPGFEDQREFVFVRKAETEPLIFMQSSTLSDLCFILLPILVADPAYRLEIAPEDAEELHLPTNRQPRIGEDVLCAALVCAGEQQVPTVNLMSPIVANLRDQIGMQVIRSDSGYSHQFQLFAGELVACS